MKINGKKVGKKIQRIIRNETFSRIYDHTAPKGVLKSGKHSLGKLTRQQSQILNVVKKDTVKLSRDGKL